MPKAMRFDVRDLERMLDSGILSEGERVELIDGELIAMAAMYNPHIYAIRKLTRELAEVFPAHIDISCQLPLNVLDNTQPIPDFYVMRPDYDARDFPTAAACALVIEISDSTLRFDQTVKLPRYASSGIPEYWIVDLRHRRLEVYRNPDGEDYLEKSTLKPGQSAQPLEFPALSVRWEVALLEPSPPQSSSSG